jgi:hypothetical protein
MSCVFEPLRMKTRERRDELGKATIGDTGKPRKRPHRGNDWGDRAGSAGKDFYAVHAGKVVKVLKTGELGHSIIIERMGCLNPNCKGRFDEYNHSNQATKLKVGEMVTHNTVLNQMGDMGSPGANHLHASSAFGPVPHDAPVGKLVDLFKDIDAATAVRRAEKAAATAAKPLIQNPEGH